MKILKSMSMVAAAAVFGVTVVSTAVFAATWEKGGYGPELYGLPHVAQVHTEKAGAQLDFGSGGYGLPSVMAAHNVKKSWEKIDFGPDVYGLPNVGMVHKMK
jgi:hypothetical protein